MLSRSAVRATMRAMQSEKQAMEEKATLAKQELEKVLQFLNGTVLKDTTVELSDTDESAESTQSTESSEEGDAPVEKPVEKLGEKPSEIKIVFSQAALDATKRAAEAEEAALLHGLEAYEDNDIPISQNAVNAMRRAKEREDMERVQLLDSSNDWQWPSLESKNDSLSSVC